MTRLLFTNLTMLVGLGALAVPILIHLLIRRKNRRLRFSTLRFFRRQDEQSSQRRKLRNLLLLAVRLLLLTLLVLMFARPYLPGGQAGGPGQQRRLAVFVVDRTASMQAVEGGVVRWQRAKEAMQKALGELTADDRAALVSSASHCEVLSGVAPPEVVARILQDLQPTFGKGSLGEALKLAQSIVAGAGREWAPVIHVVSDLQANACQDLSACPLPPELEVRPVKVGDVLSPNLALAGLQLQSRGTNPPHVLIVNHASDETRAVNLKLLVDEKEVLARTVLLSSGQVTRADLPLPKLAPGWHSGLARIQAGDALALDDVCHEAFFVPRPIRTLVAETRAGKREFEEESFFVVSALDPGHGLTNVAASRFEVVKVAVREAGDRLARATQPGWDLVVLPGLKAVPPGLGRELLAFVQGGGGLLVFLGDDVSAGEYNRELGSLLPLQLRHIEKNPADFSELKWHLDDYDPASPVFVVFNRPNSGNLALPEFTRRFAVATSQTDAVPATFEDGTPALASRVVGRGRVLLANLSADTAWTDWPKHKTYVPWLQSVCLHLAAQSAEEQMRAGAHLVAAEAADVALGSAAGGKTVQVAAVGGKPVLGTADSTGRLRNVDCSRPGVYSIRDQAGQELQRLAVNLPAEESDLAALTPVDFQQQVARLPEAESQDLLAGLLGQKSSVKELWRYLLLAVLGLLLAEVFLANRTFA